MREWTHGVLADVADIRPSNVDKLSIQGEQPVRLCNYMDVYANERITTDLPFMAATAAGAEIGRFRVETGDVILTKDSETPDDIGIPAVVSETLPDLVCGYHLALLKPRRDKIDPAFLAKQLGSSGVTSYFARAANGSTRYGLSYGAIARTPLRWPTLSQQQRIAEILSTLDEAIEQTEALIAKTQAIKAGLMHDLFTRGVTANGELRPPREEAPQLYKDSPLGWIPKEWRCRAVEELLAQTACPMRSGPFGSALLKDELVEDGVPLLGIDNVFRERFVANYSRKVTSHKFVELHRYAVFPGDVIITIMGTVGRCCIASDDLGSALSSKHLWTMTFDQNSVIPELICWQLNYANWVRAWFARHSQGAVMEAIQSSTLRSLMLSVPPMHEQERMRDAYRACSLTVTMEEEKRDKLLQYKHGLMHDLLTGRVPVSLPESETLAADA